MKNASHSITSGLTKSAVASFYIKTLQDEDQDSLQHVHDCYEIIWVMDGSGTHIIDMNQHLIKTNQVFCIKPRQMHHFCSDDNLEGFSFFFTESFISMGELEYNLDCPTNFYQLLSTFNGTVINPEIINDLLEIVQKMQKEMNNTYLFKNEILKRYLRIFLIYLTRQFGDSLQTVVQTRNIELVQNFKKLLEKNFKKKKMVVDYAGELCVTPNYLNEIIKKNTGFSAGHHIRQRIVLEAKRLALYSSVSMKEIGYELGFLDTAHFSKFFKMVTGSNFSQFKKEKVTLAITI